VASRGAWILGAVFVGGALAVSQTGGGSAESAPSLGEATIDCADTFSNHSAGFETNANGQSLVVNLGSECILAFDRDDGKVIGSVLVNRTAVLDCTIPDEYAVGIKAGSDDAIVKFDPASFGVVRYKLPTSDC
jgi:hypothetical protein